MIEKLLIANRGEIAIRIMRTARALGIRTVAVYSTADACAAHVREADEAFEIGPAPARESYLDMRKILEATRMSGANAVHPGYGFLSENAEFAEACTEAGIIFVGPPASAIRAMGLKDRAKALMNAAGVAVVPGYLGEDQSAARLAEEAGKVGYPVLVKAVAGGGGKGMRYVARAQDFESALESARREAKSAFGDERVLIEKYINHPRHIEMQIFADNHGNCIHLFERDCSLQRRHQKIIEEALAPGMFEVMRDAMGMAAIKAARTVGYVGAGTVEFIADASEGLRPDRFWFMEMNTRLQVEHPVTEGITALDLVEWQLRIASGEHLPLKQSQVSARGHAIEARLYAEDPDQDFLPSTGQLEYLRLPAGDFGLRIDSAVSEGDYVRPYYDPMIAKVIATAPSRMEAIMKLSHALQRVQIAGVTTNSAFLIRCLSHPDFQQGTIDTGFIERFNDVLLANGRSPPIEIFAAAARFLVTEHRQSEIDAKRAGPWTRNDCFRIGGFSRQVVAFEHNEARLEVLVEFYGDSAPQYVVAGSAVKIPSSVAVTRLSSGLIAVMHAGTTFKIKVFDFSSTAETLVGSADRIVAPTPGRITAVLVVSGQKVERGTPLVSVESMKMEHTLVAPADVRIISVEVSTGEQVEEGTVMVVFDRDGDA